MLLSTAAKNGRPVSRRERSFLLKVLVHIPVFQKQFRRGFRKNIKCSKISYYSYCITELLLILGRGTRSFWFFGEEGWTPKPPPRSTLSVSVPRRDTLPQHPSLRTYTYPFIVDDNRSAQRVRKANTCACYKYVCGTCATIGRRFNTPKCVTHVTRFPVKRNSCVGAPLLSGRPVGSVRAHTLHALYIIIIITLYSCSCICHYILSVRSTGSVDPKCRTALRRKIKRTCHRRRRDFGVEISTSRAGVGKILRHRWSDPRR